jgi:hypothetical protein
LRLQQICWTGGRQRTGRDRWTFQRSEKERKREGERGRAERARDREEEEASMKLVKRVKGTGA